MGEGKIVYDRLFKTVQDKKYIEIALTDFQDRIIQRYILKNENEAFSKEHISAVTMIASKLKFHFMITIIDEKLFKVNNLCDIMNDGKSFYNKNSIQTNIKGIIEDMLQLGEEYYTSLENAQKENGDKFALLKNLDPSALKIQQDVEEEGQSVLYMQREFDDRQYQ